MDPRVALSLLIFVVATHSYCNPIADLCSVSGIGCRDDSINSCTIKGTTMDFANFDVICYGFLYLPDGFIKGRAAMGHDFNKEGNSLKKNVTIGQGLTSSDKVIPYSFITASDISWPYGELYPVNSRAFVAGRQYSYPRSLQGRVDVCSTSSCINSCFSQSSRYYESVSDLMASRPATATTTLSSDGNLNVECSASSSHYFISISSSSFNKVRKYTMSSRCNPNAIFVFNINAGSSVVFDGTPFSATRTIYNVIGSSQTVNVRSQVYGSIINFHGYMNQTGGTIYGWVISTECPKLTQIERPLCPGNSPNPTPVSTGIQRITSGIQRVTSGNRPITSGKQSVTTSRIQQTATSTGNAGSCTIGSMRCATSETFQSCPHGTWGVSQSCPQGLTCHPSGNYIYCY